MAIPPGGVPAATRPRLERRGRRLERVPDLLAYYLGFVAAFSALLAVFPFLRAPLHWLRVAVEYVSITVTPNLAYAIVLSLLAGACRRRLRAAWWLVLLLLAVPAALSRLGQTVSGEIGYLPALLVTGGAVGVLIAARRQFTARIERGNGWKALGVLVGLLTLGVLVGWLLLRVAPGTLATEGDRLAWSVNHVLGGLGDADTTGIVGRGPRWVTFLCGLMGGLAFLTAVAVLLRPRQARRSLGPHDEARIRERLALFGENDSLGYFATRRDKTVMWSPGERAAVAYRVVGGASLAAGDPIGAPEGWAGAIEAWLTEARYFGWAPAVLGAGEAGARAYVSAGLGALELGDEAVIDVRDFRLDGRAMRVVRQAVQRVERSGHTVRIRRHADIDDAEMATVVDDADRWRDTETERGFSMALSRLGDPADGRCVLVECLDAGGTRRALLSFAPWGDRGLSLDLMRRDRTAENGVNELMVTSLVQQARLFGVERISLNFAMFRAAFEQGERIGAGPVLRLWRGFLLIGSRWWQLESLYRANAKYQPVWYPRYLCYADRRDLLRIGVAFAVAEGFVSPMRLRIRRPAHPDVSPLTSATAGGAEVAALMAATADGDRDPVAAELARQLAGLPEQVRVRRAKYDRLRAGGAELYPAGFPRTATMLEIRERFGGLPPDTRTGHRVGVAGRVTLYRTAGKLCFATLRDGSGDLQVMIALEGVGADALRCWRRDVDLGDHVGVEGEVITSRRGELSVFADRWAITAKCLRPLPDKHRGLSDPEARVRQRYLDLITNPDARRMLRLRPAAVRAVRDHLHEHGFLEVETPILQSVHGGANARPFLTHINAYDMGLYLRIAPELYLKRLMVGGAERVFELNRNFRNEGADATHNPEFTMVEAYAAYWDYDRMQALAQAMIQRVLRSVSGGTTVVRDGTAYDLGGTWRSTTVNDAISAALGEEVTADTGVEQLRKHCERAAVAYAPGWGAGHLLLQMYEELVEGRTVEPTFYRDFPIEVSPLTRAHRADPRLAERWDLVCFGAEIGTAYSELVDPVEQRRRLTEQSLLAAGGDPEAMELDEDFLRALEYAMPPSGGLGMGVDRLIMMITGKNIRETVLFPMVRPG
ncbi:bifunctional lysylphosphatidylglycerol synthetase/lysine--tRNA ligase LysX [Actinoplanes sp. CA-030573]|uniref:bifunctional lysylphosphatidylglycerol synthetase/lysine--tRNA ligase LysX n=1 Tax=Actinoplanes sp. CA-030573 TaxID=3239898 RepID=UPI003D8B6586